MTRKNFIIPAIIAAIFLVGGLIGITNNSEKYTTQDEGISIVSETITTTEQPSTKSAAELSSTQSHEDEDDYSWNTSDDIQIQLNDESITSNSSDVHIEKSVATITKAGTYHIEGTLLDGQIVVDTDDDDTVRIVLDDVDITSSDNSPIYVKKADKVVIVLADNTTNYITDGSSYTSEEIEDAPNAAIFSMADLTIYTNDKGVLDISGNYNDGISSKDGLIIKNATIHVDSIDDGIRGKDYLIVENTTINIDAGGDGLKSDNSEDAEKGYITLYNSNITIDSEGDAIAAETAVTMDGGTVDLTSGGGSAYTFNEDVSKKGIKALESFVIHSGTLIVDSADDALHSNNSIVINGGDITLSSGDDGIHADTSVEINGGDLTITKSYEGIEGSLITINDGNIHITASDDGLNVAGGNDSSAMGRPGAGGFDAVQEGAYLYLNGGYVYINAGGDGLDSNGSVAMTGGVVIVNGPTNNGNGPLDYNGSFAMTGGYLVAVGSSGMAQAPTSNISTQASMLVNLTSSQQAGTLVNIADASGNSVLTFSPAKTYQSVLLSSPELEQGETYTLSLGGTSTGSSEDGLYTTGTYNGGTEYTTVTLSGVVTTSGTGGMGGGMPGGDMRGGGRR